MRYTSFYTVKEQNYSAIEASLPTANLSKEVQDEIIKIIEDHKALMNYPT